MTTLEPINRFVNRNVVIVSKKFVCLNAFFEVEKVMNIDQGTTIDMSQNDEPRFENIQFLEEMKKQHLELSKILFLFMLLGGRKKLTPWHKTNSSAVLSL